MTLYISDTHIAVVNIKTNSTTLRYDFNITLVLEISIKGIVTMINCFISIKLDKHDYIR